MAEDPLPRILYIEPTGEIGGSGISLLALVNKLDRYAPHVVVPAEGRLSAKLREMLVPVHVLPLPQGIRRTPMRWAWSVLRLAWLCRRFHINIVHANHEFANRHASLTARLAGVPQICHVRNIQTATSFRDCWLALAPVLIANSKATERSYIAQIKTGQRSMVIYNGVDLLVFDNRRKSKTIFGFEENHFVIAQVGRIVPEKGVHILIESLAKVMESHPNVLCLIVGDTSADKNHDYLKNLKKRIIELKLQDNVIFTGFIDNITSLYVNVDLIVQPSLTEPFGRTLIEAMAMRKPVVASGVDGIIEIVEDGKSGLLVPPGDTERLAKAILRVIHNRGLSKLLAENGIKRVEEHFTIDKYVQNIEMIYNLLLNQTTKLRSYHFVE